VTVDDLIQPRGEIEPDLFAGEDDSGGPDPGGDTTARLTAYLAASQTAIEALAEPLEGAALDRAQAAFCYWRAFSAKARQIKALPTDRAFDQGQSRKYSIDQIRSLEADAAKYKAIFDALIGDSTDETAPRLLSRAVRNEVVW
jgi:hypothetical protein